eukprot:2410918-Rhodomonas_salina.4
MSGTHIACTVRSWKGLCYSIAAIVLSARYVMCGTEIGYAATRCAVTAARVKSTHAGTGIAYAVLERRCPVQGWRMLCEIREDVQY